MAKEGDVSNSQQQPDPEGRFSQEQYDMLKRCSDKRDMTEWNKWREEHPDERVVLQEAPLEKSWLEGAHLERAHLKCAHLEHAWLEDAHLEHAYLKCAHLEHAHLEGAHLEHAWLEDAHLEHTWLGGAHMEHARLGGAHLEHAWLEGAHLEHARLVYVHLEHTRLVGAHLEHAHLKCAHLEHAKLAGAHLEHTHFWQAKLQGANLSRATVDGGTLFSEECEVDRNTKFEAVALGNMRVYPKTRQLLEYNIRRMNWEQWYEDNPRLKWLVKSFWLISDYGMSTARIIVAFFGLAFVFANIYYHWGRIAPPGIVDSLFIDGNGIEVQSWLVPLRTLYFSIVTMTTLGFGDMYANAQSVWGHILLSLQVLLGYVLLAALVTRFAVLFAAGGPAGEFAKKGQDDENK